MNQRDPEKLSFQELQEVRSKCESRKAELEGLKQKGGKGWTTELQDELDNLVLYLVDVDEVVEQKGAQEAKSTSEVLYLVPEGTENLVHVELVKGHRYDSRTGKEISKPFAQMFTLSEWQLFQRNGTSLGYEVVKVLHNPYANK